jgi:acyl-coenzyme A thioesterase PaaI-like protein
MSDTKIEYFSYLRYKKRIIHGAMKKIINPWQGMEGYACYGCCPDSEKGLRMEFMEDGDYIVSRWTPRHEFEGWQNTLHGGIQATLLDEIGGWIIARRFQTSGMTTNLNIKYKKPIPTGKENSIEVRARVRETKRMFVFIEAEIRYNGEICSSAEITYYTFPKDVAERDFMFSGCEVEE